MEGKKSFVLYMTQRPTFDGLSDEDAGKLIKTIFAYCGDEYPQPDGIVKYAFEIIKPVLKSDLKKYEEIKSKRIEAGRSGGLATQSKNNQKQANALNDKPNQAVIDNVIDIVNVIDNDDEVSKDTNINVSFNKETTPEATKNMPPVVIALPCLKGYNHPIYEDDINHYQDLYPAVNVHQELKLMLGWLESNPNNRKTKNGIKAFITRWLSKKQDKAPTNTEGYKPPKPKRSDFDSVDEFYKAYDEWAIKYNNGFNEFELADNKIGNSDGWRQL